MKATFTLENKTITNGEIENISLLVKLGRDFEGAMWFENEDNVYEALEENTNLLVHHNIEVECPCSDLVYVTNYDFTGDGYEGIYPANDGELNVLKEIYEELAKIYGGYKVFVSVYSNYLYKEDFTLEEFLENFKLIEEGDN